MPTRAKLQVRLLGDMAVLRDGKPVALPRSKKTRALLAYLTASGRAHRREHLCSVFWDIPDDPRGSLRWSLSKLRPIVDDPDLARILADRDSVRFLATGAEVDVLELRQALTQELEALGPVRLETLAQVFRGEFLEGLDLPSCLDFQAWLVAQRDEARGQRARILRALLSHLDDDPETALPHVRALIQLDRHDESAWNGLVRRLAMTGRRLEAEQQYEAGCAALAELGPERDRALTSTWRQINASGGAAKSPKDPAESAEAGEPAALSLPEKPSIAVLPFENASGDPADLYLAEGIAADLIERLGHDPRIFVIARASSFAFSETQERTPIDSAEAHERLGVRHVLEGAVRWERSSLVASTRLVDTTRREVLWTRDFKCPSDGVYMLVRDLAEAVTQTIDIGANGVPDLTFGLPHPKLEAWRLFHDGARYLYRRADTDLTRALEIFEEAVHLDTGFARARAATVDAMYYQMALDYLSPAAEWRDSMMCEARQAHDSAPGHASVHCALGQAYLVLRQPTLAIPAFEAAVALNPSFAWAHYGIGAAMVLSGNAAKAGPHLDKAIRLSPLDRNMGSFLLRRADAYFFMGRYEEAAAWARRALRQPLFQWSRYAVLLSALGHLDRQEEAREVLDELLGRRPDFSLELVRGTHLYTDQVNLTFISEPQLFVDQDEFAHYLDGLRKAGVPSS